MAKKEPFNNPFRHLRLPEAPARTPPAPPPAAAPAPKPPPDDEAHLFLRAVGDVKPLRRGPDRVAAGPKRPAVVPRILDEEEEALAELCELVAGNAPFDIADSDEFIEGAVASLDRRILRRLRAGEYAIQGILDLHGLTRTEAREALIRFVEKSRGEGKRCVLVIHGRGLHSKDQIPVLKEGVQQWLTRGRLSGQVLAFATARPHDGGAGAVYVLLRR
ncbi:MAG TPA: Smr/MutS family protein [Fredinandcohnia sp.]|nr:Smr/MutS family protein [Fredinandcohnia sp.]